MRARFTVGALPSMKKSFSAKPARSPRRLAPLRVSNGFREFVLGQLAEVREFHAKPMFGGLGLYSGDVFFGIVAGDVLYFKVDETIRADYEQAGSRPFKPYADRPVTMQYYSVPAAVVEDAADLAQWARRSIAGATKVKSRKLKVKSK
jgi:DNA transformation protein